MSLAGDPRWQRFNDSSRACPCCGQTFSGVFDIGYDHPDPWPHGNRAQSGEDVLAVGDDKLTADLCAFGKYRFVRCVLPIPIIGSDQRFAFGPWGSVSQDSYDIYVRNFYNPNEPFDGCFAWLTNQLPGFGIDEPLPCNLVPGANGQRPVLEVHDGAHELAELQETGITFDRLLDIYAAAGQDIRPHLLQS